MITNTLQHLPLGLAWRYSMYTSYLFYLRTCKNYEAVLRAARHGPDLQELVLRNGLRLELTKPAVLSLATFREIWQKKVYLRDFRIRSPRLVVDIGAHIGLFAVQAASRWPHARVLAYEPGPANYQMLRRNIARNALRNVTAFNQAVCGYAGLAELRVKGQSDTHSIYDTPFGGPLQEVVAVECVTLKEIVAQSGDASIDLLKIDCEGCEYDIVRTADEVLRTRVRHLVMEYHEGFAGRPEDLVKALRAAGFRVQRRPHPGTGVGLLIATRREGAG